MQNIVTEGNGLKIPIPKLKKSVTEVMVIDTAASLNICAILNGTGSFNEVLLQAANMTKVSSIPIPLEKTKVTLYIDQLVTRLIKPITKLIVVILIFFL